MLLCASMSLSVQCGLSVPPGAVLGKDESIVTVPCPQYSIPAIDYVYHDFTCFSHHL